MHKSLSLSKNFRSQIAKQILETAANIVAERFVREGTFTNSQSTKAFLSFKLNQHEREVFAVMLLDSQHQLIEFQALLFGTIDYATVHPRAEALAGGDLNG